MLPALAGGLLTIGLQVGLSFDCVLLIFILLCCKNLCQMYDLQVFSSFFFLLSFHLIMSFVAHSFKFW